jgi:hypothetical protein
MNSPDTDKFARLCLTDDRAGSINDVSLPYYVCATIESRLRQRIAELEDEKLARMSTIEIEED